MNRPINSEDETSIDIDRSIVFFMRQDLFMIIKLAADCFDWKWLHFGGLVKSWINNWAHAKASANRLIDRNERLHQRLPQT